MNMTVQGYESNTSATPAPHRAFMIAPMLVSVWIVLVNALVLAFLVIYRHSLKNFVSLQILSLSVTDTLVGLTAILLTMADKIIESFPYSEPCAVILYGYDFAQTATVYHALVICIHRLLILKTRKSSTETNPRHMYKTLLVQISIPWFVSLIICLIPFLVFGRYGRTIQKCSLKTIFEDNHLRAMTLLSVNILAPQIGMNTIYIYVLVFLLRQWRRVDILQVTPEQLASTSGSYMHTNYEGATKRENLKLSCLGTDPPAENRDCKPQNKHLYLTRKANRNFAVLALSDQGNRKYNDISKLAKKAVRNSAAMRTQKQYETIGQKDVLITIGLILLCFNVFMSPFTFLAAMEGVIGSLISQQVKLLMMALALLNSALNPFIYIFRIKPFRDALHGCVSKIYVKTCRCH